MSAATSDLRAVLDAITSDEVLLKNYLPRIPAMAHKFWHNIVQ